VRALIAPLDATRAPPSDSEVMRGTAAATVPIGTAATHAPATEAIVARHPIPPHFIALLLAASPAEDAAAAAVVCALENLGAVRPAAAALVSQIKSTQATNEIKSCQIKNLGAVWPAARCARKSNQIYWRAMLVQSYFAVADSRKGCTRATRPSETVRVWWGRAAGLG
jgi:hypothetical protein